MRLRILESDLILKEDNLGYTVVLLQYCKTTVWVNSQEKAFALVYISGAVHIVCKFPIVSRT